MTTKDAARQASALVRIAVASCVVTIVPGVAAVHSITGTLTESTHGVSSSSLDPSMSSDAASRVADLVRGGLECGPDPRLTDTVVVEWPDGSAQVVGFDQALRVAADRDGRLRSYCVTPRITG